MEGESDESAKPDIRPHGREDETTWDEETKRSGFDVGFRLRKSTSEKCLVSSPKHEKRTMTTTGVGVVYDKDAQDAYADVVFDKKAASVRPASSTSTALSRKEKLRLHYICLCVCFAILLVIVAVVTYVYQKDSTDIDRHPDGPKSLWLPIPSKSVLGVYEKAAVASDGAPCSVVGKDILSEGGSAVDAMIGVALCNGVFNMHSMGIGGGFFMNYYNATSGEAHVIDAREEAPHRGGEGMYANRSQSYAGGLAIAVPGELNGYWEAHRRFGRLPWSRLFEPAIKMAEDGHVFSNENAKALNASLGKVEELGTNLGNLMYNKAKNRWFREGDLFKNTRLARVLRTVSREGPRAFYNGSLTSEIVADIKDLGGIIDEIDLNNIQPRVKPPMIYKMRRGWKVFGPPPPSSALIVAFLINILEGFESNELTLQDKVSLLLSFHRYTEAMKFAYAQRTYLGDSTFVNVTESLENLVDHRFADNIRRSITNSTHDSSFYGPATNVSRSGTSHNSVLAPDGDAVSLTSTINSYFGAKVVGPRTGIIFNNEMDDFSIPESSDSFGIAAFPSNYIRPGKKPMSSQSPMIVVDESGKVRVVVGASGGSKIISATTSVLRNLLFFNQDVKSAVDSPRLHHQLLPDVVEFEEFAPKQLVEDLAVKYGHQVKRNSRRNGIVQAIHVNDAGQVTANCDFRKGGAPAGF